MKELKSCQAAAKVVPGALIELGRGESRTRALKDPSIRLLQSSNQSISLSACQASQSVTLRFYVQFSRQSHFINLKLAASR